MSLFTGATYNGHQGRHQGPGIWEQGLQNTHRRHAHASRLGGVISGHWEIEGLFLYSGALRQSAGRAGNSGRLGFSARPIRA